MLPGCGLCTVMVGEVPREKCRREPLVLPLGFSVYPQPFRSLTSSSHVKVFRHVLEPFNQFITPTHTEFLMPIRFFKGYISKQAKKSN